MGRSLSGAGQVHSELSRRPVAYGPRARELPPACGHDDDDDGCRHRRHRRRLLRERRAEPDSLRKLALNSIWLSNQQVDCHPRPTLALAPISKQVACETTRRRDEISSRPPLCLSPPAGGQQLARRFAHPSRSQPICSRSSWQRRQGHDATVAASSGRATCCLSCTPANQLQGHIIGSYFGFAVYQLIADFSLSPSLSIRPLYT